MDTPLRSRRRALVAQRRSHRRRGPRAGATTALARLGLNPPSLLRRAPEPVGDTVDEHHNTILVLTQRDAVIPIERVAQHTPDVVQIRPGEPIERRTVCGGLINEYRTAA